MLKKSLIVMDTDQVHNVYGPDQIAQIEEMTTLIAPPLSTDEFLKREDLMAQVEVLYSGWGICPMDEAFLAKAPQLEAVFYGAGSIRNFAGEAFYNKGLTVTSSFSANAVPVAEFTFAQIILALKKGQFFMRSANKNKKWENQKRHEVLIPGCYRRTVGLISLGMIGGMVLDFLQSLDVEIKVYDIFENKALAEEKNFTYCSLEEVFQTSDVVSLHTAFLPATLGMIKGEHFSMMKEDASFINTARGGLIDEPGMTKVLAERQDLSAFLDVVYPEPAADDNPLLFLDNVYLTPHIAGSQQQECRRMGQMAIDESARYFKGEPLKHQITYEMLETMA